MCVIKSAGAAAGLSDIARSWRANPVKLKRLLARYEHNESDVEDIIQDALVEAVRCIDRFEGKSSLETWLFGIALNVARHHVASATRRARHVVSLDNLLDDESPDALDHLCESPQSFDPVHQMQSVEFARHLIRCVGALPRELQKTFELLCIHECSYIEAAETLGIPIGTVRSRLHRVRTLLRPALA
ncbi:RNA polymerase sigma factor (sigma-70 family) [Variovorax boronicumulans]|uniref:sigma-70 family RNA polymerase sigma factor n=1 Tax=Variovorax boronicumulans TaxID=436515 RepID=UPI00278ABC8C|nr:sigma-70 family RNA polymerase sigma factor [Variovorax boronicumulans]MDQ0083804.1 RNA polymerase sigma factor (sigma-70 family) [Variovorax boronicumulans]